MECRGLVICGYIKQDIFLENVDEQDDQLLIFKKLNLGGNGNKRVFVYMIFCVWFSRYIYVGGVVGGGTDGWLGGWVVGIWIDEQIYG